MSLRMFLGDETEDAQGTAELGDLLGWVTTSSATELRLVDRWARGHVVPRARIVALRRIPLVAPGRNPAHGDGQMLARMLTDISGSEVAPEQVAVRRLSELVTSVLPALDLLDEAADLPDEADATAGPVRLRWRGAGVIAAGEWAALDVAEADPATVHALAGWAVLHNARNVAVAAEQPPTGFIPISG